MKIIINTNKIRKYFRDNLGSPFIIIFQMLLLYCASLLIIGNSKFADEISIYAFYFLTIGVILQMISYLRQRNKIDDIDIKN